MIAGVDFLLTGDQLNAQYHELWTSKEYIKNKVIIHMAWVLYIISVNTENDHLVCIAS